MDCHEVAAWLVLPPDDPEDRAMLETHLQSCQACTARAVQMSRLDDALSASLVVEPPVALSLRLVALARAAAAPSRTAAVAALDARTIPATAGVDANPARAHLRRPLGWTERLVGFGFLAVLTFGLWSLLGLNPLLTAISFAWGVVVSVQAILTSPAWSLLANPTETFGPLISVAAALLLVWVLLHESARQPLRSSRRPTF